MSNHQRNSIGNNRAREVEEYEVEEELALEIIIAHEEQRRARDNVVRRPMYDREYTGRQYVNDVLAGHPVRTQNCFRLSPAAFTQLCELMVNRGLLCDNQNMAATEQLGIFLRAVAHADSFRQLSEFFQHSLETISRHFRNVLRGLLALATDFIVLPTEGVETHPQVSNNSNFYPYFKDALGAIDGTHIQAIVPLEAQNRYRNRKGFTSQNVIAAVSFDRQFLYVGTGWEGSAADMRVLRWAIEKGNLRVPENKYYLVDSGYANTNKYIAPYRGVRYHLSEYRSGSSRQYNGPNELFNHRHAQLRNVVERTFGIWKERFQILNTMRQYPTTIQADVVLACAVLHNFIGRYHGNDVYFNMAAEAMVHDRDMGEVGQSGNPDNATSSRDRLQGTAERDRIAVELWSTYVEEHNDV